MVRATTDGRVRTLTLDRPESKNALTPDAAIETAEAIEDAVAADVRAIVLTGEGDAFSAGGDVEAMDERDETPRESYERMSETMNAVIETILNAPVPVVAKVNGDAIGAGTNLVAACDFAIASREARFGEVFVNVGLIPDSGGTVILPRLVGLRTAKELAMTGRIFDAEEAERLDLINRAVGPDDLEDEVDSLLATLGNRPTETLALTKRGFHGNVHRSLDEGLEYEALLQSLAYGTDAHDEGVAAFLEKRDPEFR
ncbi:enoyl-CoA hydratase/isomerase family protein [Natrarchaeobius oligotrophus]|uniref:Enoyl-CoA hydratase/isomerase family protein n=1 Tax=Natrarchaeobius chitinivorans TaxID=1679083 RepID=A0A3N6PLM0_NATCH|nr:enoyl-CoA hydratase/isomerase family protein [Natrarchaeobius chitinivorans]RQH02360.1 enoyl-CoA hydratase/isomerase family protein [Natrarchaeobius chitinivorans]